MNGKGFPSTPSSPQIQQVFMYVTDGGEDGQETVVAFLSGLSWHPMVCTDESTAELMRAKAQEIAKATGQQIRLVRFTGAPEVRAVFEP
jgi:hypothetical protein